MVKQATSVCTQRVKGHGLNVKLVKGGCEYMIYPVECFSDWQVFSVWALASLFRHSGVFKKWEKGDLAYSLTFL